VRRVRCDDWDREYKGELLCYSAAERTIQWFLKYVVEKGVAALRMEYVPYISTNSHALLIP
jgi:hypothetical protein